MASHAAAAACAPLLSVHRPQARVLGRQPLHMLMPRRLTPRLANLEQEAVRACIIPSESVLSWGGHKCKWKCSTDKCLSSHL